MFKKKPETVLITRIFIGGKFISETSAVIGPGPDWFMRIVLVAVIPLGFWLMAMQGAF